MCKKFISIVAMLLLGVSPLLAEGLQTISSENYSNYSSYGIDDSNYSSYVGYFAITNAADLVAFANSVNAGKVSANAVMLTDIDLSGVTWTPIGNATTTAYTGHFEGRFHRVKNMVIDNTAEFQALFSYANSGCVINGVIIDSTCSVKAGSYSAGLVGGIKSGTSGGTVTISNCGNEASVDAGQNGSGLFGCHMDGNVSLIITNCYNTGNVKATKEGGLISGWLGGKITISNCWAAGTITGNDSGKPFARFDGSLTFNNCYILSASGSQIGITTATQEEFASGIVCYKLNGSTCAGDLAWKQTIGTDAYPTFVGETVYASSPCPLNISNDPSANTTLEHSYVDGICSVCGATHVPDLVSGYYEIANKAELMWFVSQVNVGNTSINAKLTADIVLNNNVVKSDYSGRNDGTFESWTTIGSSSNQYAGTFDGNGHSISGLYHNASTNNFAMFNYTTKTAVIRNLQIKDSYIYAEDYNGGFVSSNYGTIENCSFDGYISADDYIGGFVYKNYGTIRNCFYHGYFRAYSNPNGGGICYSNQSGATISNCYVSATIPSGKGSAICGYNYGTLSNIYYNNQLTQNATVYSGLADVKGKSTAEFASGRVCYWLNGSTCAGDLVWKQTIGTDALPVFIGGTVYVSSPCPASCSNNPASSTTLEHSYVNGVCEGCGASLVPALVDGYYEISNKGELLWFASQVTTGNTNINAKLTADIVLNSNVLKSDYSGKNNGTFEKWTPIGSSSNPYTGTFDGNGHSISGLYYNARLSHFALFTETSKNAVIRNLQIKDSYIYAYNYSAGFVKINKGTIENCSFDGYIDAYQYCGGFAYNNNGTIRNCFYHGYFRAYSNSYGGVICYSNVSSSGAKVSNCYVSATIPSGNGSVICSYINSGTSVINCYYNNQLTQNVDVYYGGGDIKGKSTAEFASGRVCYWLNGSTSAGDLVWKQTIGTDALPVFTGGTVYVSTPCPTTCSNDPSFSTTLEHSYVDDVCENCGEYKTPQLVDGYYEISSKGELLWFASQVNAGNTSINARLTSDIVLNNNVLKSDYSGKNDGTFESWTTIGSSSNQYAGTFDGNGHSISGLYHNSYNSYFGMFGYTTNTAMIRNLQIKDAYINEADYNAGLVRYNYGTIENCSFDGYINANQYNGGLVYYNYGTIRNCFYHGYFKAYGNSYGGAIFYSNASSSSAKVSNCYASVTIPSGKGSAICSYINSGTTVSNCYYNNQLTQNASVYSNNGTADVKGKSTAEFQSGEVCYLLNGSTSDGTLAWKQTLGIDALPNFVGPTVYLTSPCVTYTNTNGSVLEHTFAENGVCSVCGKGTAASLVDGVYQIATPGNLVWFSDLVNSGNDTANAILTTNIDMTGVHSYAPIGYISTLVVDKEITLKGYKGTFDGAGYVISNLSATVNSKYVTSGVFGTVSGMVKNLGVDNYSYSNNTFDGRFGAVVGQVFQGTIKNCYVVNSTVADNNHICGAIAGCNYAGTIENCFEYNNSITAHSRCGKLVGDNRNDVSNTSSSAYYAGTITNCYSTGALQGTQTGVVTNGESNISTDRFNSGEVCYLMNGSTSVGDLIWGQRIGVNNYPVLWESTSQTVYYNNERTPAYYNGDCIHKSELVAEVPSTCTVNGTAQHYICSYCKNIFSDAECTIAVTAADLVLPLHTIVVDTAVAATCTVAGKTAGSHCSVCNEVLVAQQEVAALGHTEVADTAVAATCTVAGKTAGSHCSVCNTVFVAQQEVAALGHTEVADTAVAATCTVAGKTAGSHCSVCNEVIVVQQEVAALGHTEVADTAVAATCTEAGKTAGSHCSVCNEVIVAQQEVAAHHTEVADTAVAATCTATGKTEGKHCSVCNEVLVAQQEVAALGHTVVVDAAKEPTTTETGLTEGSHCSVCNAVIVAQKVVPMLQPATVSSIEITSLPSKLEYTIGEDLDLTGAEIKVTYTDGTTKTITVTPEMIAGFDSQAAGAKDVQVVYESVSASFQITVKPATSVVDKSLETTIYVHGHTIVVETQPNVSDDIVVFSINGQMISRTAVVTNRTKIEIAKAGIYLVQVGKEVKKVAIQ